METRNRKLAAATPVIAGFLLLALIGRSPADESKKTIQFQARITNNGIPVTGTLNIVFRVYDQESGGTPMWEATHMGVVVRNGILSVRLGSVPPSSNYPPLDAVFKDGSGTSDDRWIAVLVDGNEVVVPRVKLTSVPYAVNAVSATTATLASSAETALTADYATTSGHSSSADSAAMATSALSAGTASFAGASGHAWTSDSAAVATTAITANSATYATNAGHAGVADSAAVTTAIWDASTGTSKTLADMIAGLDLRYPLLTGQAGGQTLIGGTSPADDLTLKSTSAISPTGFIVLGNDSKLDGLALFKHQATPGSVTGPYTAVYAKSDGDLYRFYNGTETKIGAGGGSGTVLASVNDGRLTLSSTASVTTTDVTSATLYYLPHKGNQIALYDGSSWSYHSFTSASASATALTAGKNYDVFAYLSSGAVALELVEWTTNTARAAEPVLQDGALVKSGDATRRFLGTVRTISGPSFSDTKQQRFLVNWQNRVQTAGFTEDPTPSWTEAGGGTGTWSTVDANHSAWKCEFLVPVGGSYNVSAIGNVTLISSSSTSSIYALAIDLDWTTGPPSRDGGLSSMIGRTESNATAGTQEAWATYAGAPKPGYHYLQAVETAYPGYPALLFGGNSAFNGYRSGMQVVLWR